MACSLLLLDSATVETDTESDYNVPLIHLETLKSIYKYKVQSDINFSKGTAGLGQRGFLGSCNKSSDVTVW